MAEENKPKLLFLDTESDAKTKEIISIQYGYCNTFDTLLISSNHSLSNVYNRINELWNNCDAVIMFNAPYDLGVLATLPGNKFNYKNSSWYLKLFGNNYRVKRINGLRNLIKPQGNKSKPVIDLLKLWSILINDNDISLKSLIKKELHETPIPYTAENAKTRAYQLQDVIQLEKLWYKFLEKIQRIPPVKNYTLNDFCAVSTPATFSKKAYKEKYPLIHDWQKYNEQQDKKYNLSYALERAYNGGITAALYRGTAEKTAWYDIHGAYAHVIEFLNTDKFKKYHWLPADALPDGDAPALCYVETNTFLTSINHSLKLFQTVEMSNTWIWNYDILALQNIFPNAEFKILKIFLPIPELNIQRSLSAMWSDLKEEEEQKNGKTTLREYYKFMSNTSYGITAQRTPYKTVHTNLCIAGIITSRTHLILSQMIKTARQHGFKWVYSDTDSICISGVGDIEPAKLETEINRIIYPYSVGCEFIGTTRILSLKRYYAFHGTDILNNKIPDKIRLHGKSVYRITDKDMLELLNTGKSDKDLIISQISANTAITYNRVLKLNTAITNPHPFMFETNINTGLLLIDWFDKWIEHIDRKATTPDNAKIYDNFDRTFKTFHNISYARLYYGLPDDNFDIDDYTGLSYRLYDIEDKLIFENETKT